MPWCRSGDKPLSEPMMVSLMTHICVTRPQWVNALNNISNTFHHPLIGLITLYFNIITSMRMHIYLNGYFAISSLFSGNYDSCKATVKAIASDYISPGVVINRDISGETNAIEINHICEIPSPVTSDKNASTCTPVVQAHQQLQAIFITPSLIPRNQLSVEVILMNVDDCSSPAWTWFVESECQPGLFTECSRTHLDRTAEFTHCAVTCHCGHSCDFLYLKYNRLPRQNQTSEQLCEIWTHENR